MKNAIRELLRQKINSRQELMAIKRKIAKKYGIGTVRNSDILAEYRQLPERAETEQNSQLEKILRKRSIRTMSGIAPVAVLTKPYPCPGECVFCPSDKNTPQSYLANEPAVMRAIRCEYEPYQQVQYRLRALEANGHQPEKIELIVIGGTWSVLPEAYKYWFIKECFRGANDYGKEKAKNSKRGFKIAELKKILSAEQKKNEQTKYRIIGLTLETRPDYINESELWQMRELGCTRVELGVQAVDDKILKFNRRGHGVAEITAATAQLKNFGFKVTYHLMPGLPGANPKKDLKLFNLLFQDERFQPDQIKFYPTVVTKGSLLYQWWRQGKYRPYSDRSLQSLIIECKKAVPLYVRIIRLIRDIPGESIEAGNKITNLRQIIKNRGVVCRCIRCREAGERKFSILDLKFSIIRYRASGGKEFFIQATDKSKNILYGFCRLRLGQRQSFPVARKNSMAMIRELHVYGELMPVGKNQKIQHVGLGKKLLQMAEAIAKKNNYAKMAAIAGVGVRGYYRKMGFRLNRTYMLKSIA